MTEPIHPWTSAAQERAGRTLQELHARVCAPERLLAWNDVEHADREGTCVVYWMARAHRGIHNLALDSAIAAATALRLPVLVLLRLSAGPVGTELRHVDVVLRGLPDALADCAARGAHVAVAERTGPGTAAVLDRLRPALVVTDDDVMPAARRSRYAVAATLRVPMISVDTDVVVPGACFPRQEYAARTLRPKLHRVLAAFEGELGDDRSGTRAPALPAPPAWHAIEHLDLHAPGTPRETWQARIAERLQQARDAGTGATAGPIDGIEAGTRAGLARLEQFATATLTGYATARNKPELDATSRLSMAVHYGHLSPHAVVARVRAADVPAPDSEAFLEEFIVRRELSWNYVRWNSDAASLDGAPAWARRTLAAHASDPREWLWSDDDLEAGDTHDPLWNAAQRQMVERGHMHGYLRMYWAKKLLEWRADPADAFDIALRLNDRWQLDGRDPNGIVGVAWAIAGVHDRPWHERPIFGQIRYMSLASTGRKFDSRAFVRAWGGVRGAALQEPGRYA